MKWLKSTIKIINMNKTVLKNDIIRCCKSESSTLDELVPLLDLAEDEKLDLDTADLCRIFCENHPCCEVWKGEPIERFIKRTDELGIVDYLVFTEKTGWDIWLEDGYSEEKYGYGWGGARPGAGRPKKEGERVSFRCELPKDAAEILKASAEREGLSRTDYLTKLLRRTQNSEV